MVFNASDKLRDCCAVLRSRVGTGAARVRSGVARLPLARRRTNLRRAVAVRPSSPTGTRRRVSVLAGALVALSVLLPGMEPTAVTAHNLQTKMVYMFVDPTTQTLLDNRINDG